MNNKLIPTIAAAWFCVAGLPAQAEDTEVYFVNPSSGSTVVNPNVVFIFDTSGSMDDHITTREAYDSSRTYPPAWNYDPDYYYVYSSNETYITRVHKDRLQCPTLEAAVSASSPRYITKAAYRTTGWFSGWYNLCGGGWFCGFDSSDDVECQDDSTESISWGGISSNIFVDPNYHSYTQSVSTVSRRKTDIMKDAANSLVDDFDGLNFALMRFNGGSGGYVIQDFIDITPAANKTTLKGVINNLPASGSTPLSETLYEAMLYLSGGTADWGSGRGDSAAQTGGVYNSGITNACQQTHIVYLTDGEPTSDTSSENDIEALPGLGTCVNDHGDSDGKCLDELAGWMYRTDLIDNNILAGTQNVTTHTIGFDIDLDLLRDTASAGGGQYYTANDYVALKQAFTSILITIGEQKDTFVAPAVSVNAYNSLQNSDQLYYALFQPSNTPRWAGNLKRYRVDSDAIVRDVADLDAVDGTTGFFKDTAQSWWSPGVDGNNVSLGGARSVLAPPRNLFTYTGSVTGGAGPNNTDITLDAHALSKDNTAMTNAMLGLQPEITGDDRGRGDLLDWVGSGLYLGDILHSQPLVVTYGETGGNLVETIFVSSNLGFLHAFNSSDGKELFGFSPQELLGNFTKYFENDANTPKVYGLDGTLAVWTQESATDTDFNIDPSASSTDHVYLYTGMRRGGDHIYALDVTDIQGADPKPKLMWQINGPASDPSATGFTNKFPDLGQTWSTPRVGKVKWNCTAGVCEDKHVLFFGGGYDTQQDALSAPAADTVGNAIYMVDAVSGDLLWSVGDTGHKLNLASMTSSIPANVTIGDVDSDGYIDFVFAVDIQGRIWRIDLVDYPAGTNGNGFATGGLIAELGGFSSGDADFRRFYSGLDVALFRPRGKAAYLSISVGSGFRAHPNNNDLTDRFYSVRDYNPYTAPPVDLSGNPVYQYVDDSGTMRPIRPGDMANASDNYSTQVSGSATNPYYGWYKNLDSGEKVLTSSITFGGVTLFTSYSPPNTNTCGALGEARLYALDTKTGSSRLLDDANDTLLYKVMAHPGIPPEPAIIYAGQTTGTGTDTKNTVKPILCVGTECFADILDAESPLTKSFWRENQ